MNSRVLRYSCCLAAQCKLVNTLGGTSRPVLRVSYGLNLSFAFLFASRTIVLCMIRRLC